jgi:hypothetical protein
MKWARDVLVKAGTGKVPGKLRSVALRMVKLSPIVVLDLNAEEAPIHVFRWVSWAKGPAAQRRRTDLAVHLRRTIERRRNGWLEERHLTAALAVWEAAVADARARGLVTPRPDAVPAGRYQKAIDAARKGTRGPSPPLGDELAPVDVTGGETMQEVAGDRTPTEERPSRTKTLSNLTAAMASALADGDMEAARVAHEAIGKLVPAKLPG